MNKSSQLGISKYLLRLKPGAIELGSVSGTNKLSSAPSASCIETSVDAVVSLGPGASSPGTSISCKWALSRFGVGDGGDKGGASRPRAWRAAS